jgi:hypothetical protein
MSAFTPEADIEPTIADVRYVPGTDLVPIAIDRLIA